MIPRGFPDYGTAAVTPLYQSDSWGYAGQKIHGASFFERCTLGFAKRRPPVKHTK